MESANRRRPFVVADPVTHSPLQLYCQCDRQSNAVVKVNDFSNSLKMINRSAVLINRQLVQNPANYFNVRLITRVTHVIIYAALITFVFAFANVPNKLKIVLHS